MIPNPLEAATSGSARYADERTPLIRNCWYVAALGSEVTRELKQRYILCTSVVLYRSLSGEAVALQDRCPHRSFPLSKGSLEGDNLVCGYHGLTFEPTGACVRAPMSRSIPRQVRIHRYPLLERGPLIWIWMGDPENARMSECPMSPWLDWMQDAGWTAVHNFVPIPTNYVSMHENLLDMTHFSYLHAGNAGTPEWASSPFEVRTEDQTVSIVRRLENSPPPALYASPMGLEPTRPVNRTSDSRFITPALHLSFLTIESLEPGAQRKFRANIVNILTPETQNSTHYWNFIGRSWALDESSADEWLRASALKAALEDQDALQAIATLKLVEQRPGFTEASFPSDRAGMSMRRMLHRLAEKEMA